MSSAPFTKSKAFKEREQKVKENLRRATKQDLVADLSRLFEDTTFSDVLFIVDKKEFPAHAAILRARAPKFCRRFLPAYASADAIQTCIQIHGLEPSQFEEFLRSAYTEDSFKDYDQSSYPWTKQELATEKGHLITEKEEANETRLDAAVVKCSGTTLHNLDAQTNACTVLGNNERLCDGGACTPSAKSEPAKDSREHNNKDFVGNSFGLETPKETCSQTSEGKFVVKNGLPGSFLSMRNGSDTLADSNRPVLHVANVEKSENTTTETSVNCREQRCYSVDSLDVSVQEGTENISARMGVNVPGDRSQSSGTLSDSCNGLPSAIELSELSAKTSELTLTNGKVRKTSLERFITTENKFYTSVEIDRSSVDDLDVEDAATQSDMQSNILGHGDCETVVTESVEEFIASETGHNKAVARSLSEDELLESCCKLGQDLLQLLRNGVGTDVTFLVDGKQVKAHKAILCARSNYFSAMLHGGWIEGARSEIPLIGVSYNGLMIVLSYVYGGAAVVTSDMTVMCDVLPLVDMYGLERLKEVIVSTLRIEKCHLFHKPCSECLTSVFECLELSELFSLVDLKKSCIKWVAKHFDRVLCTKGFAYLSKTLQNEVLAEINGGIMVSSAVEVLNHCDRLVTCTPVVKWTEPVHVAVSAIQESCLLFITENFLSLVGDSSFQAILKGVGWSIPVLEKIFSSLQGNLTVQTSCDQLQAVLRLRGLLRQWAREEEERGKKTEESYPQEVIELVDKLHGKCMEFMRSNLFKVTRSAGWKRLSPRTQREVKEGAVFGGLGDTATRSSSAGASGRNGLASSAQASRRPPMPTRSSFQNTALGSHTVGRGEGRTASVRPPSSSSASARPSSAGPSSAGPSSAAPSSARGRQGSSSLAPAPKRPSRGRPLAAQNLVPPGRGKTPSSSNSSGKRPSSAQGRSVSNDVSAGRASTLQVSGQRARNAPPVNASSVAPCRGKSSCSSARRDSKGKPSSRSSETLPAPVTVPSSSTGRGKGSSSVERSKARPLPGVSRGLAEKPQTRLRRLSAPNSLQRSAKATAVSRPLSVSGTSCKAVNSSRVSNSKTAAVDERSKKQAAANTGRKSIDMATKKTVKCNTTANATESPVECNTAANVTEEALKCTTAANTDRKSTDNATEKTLKCTTAANIDRNFIEEEALTCNTATNTDDNAIDDVTEQALKSNSAANNDSNSIDDATELALKCNTAANTDCNVIDSETEEALKCTTAANTDRNSIDNATEEALECNTAANTNRNSIDNATEEALECNTAANADCNVIDSTTEEARKYASTANTDCNSIDNPTEEAFECDTAANTDLDSIDNATEESLKWTTAANTNHNSINNVTEQAIKCNTAAFTDSNSIDSAREEALECNTAVTVRIRKP